MFKAVAAKTRPGKKIQADKKTTKANEWSHDLGWQAGLFGDHGILARSAR